MKSILDELYEIRMSSGIEQMLKSDTKYQENSMEIREMAEIIDDMNLLKEQRDCIEEYAELHTKSNYEYARIAYNCGFEDAMQIVLRLLKKF